MLTYYNYPSGNGIPATPEIHHKCLKKYQKLPTDNSKNLWMRCKSWHQNIKVNELE